MPVPQFKTNSRLRGVAIFLSASVPTPERREEYERVPEAPLQIEEAVACVARAIFAEGGTLVFGAHPSITPLIARVVDHYYLPPAAENNPAEKREENFGRTNPAVKIFQSEVWKPLWAESTQRFVRHPLVEIEWIRAEAGETVDSSIKDRPQAPKSMERMRLEMIERTSPVAMIAIGGMKGVLDEAEYFIKLRPGKPIFAFATTGGAAALLSGKTQFRQPVRIADENARALVRKFWESQQGGKDPRSNLEAMGDPTTYLPYAFLAQHVVAQIIKEFVPEI